MGLGQHGESGLNAPLHVQADKGIGQGRVLILCLHMGAMTVQVWE